MQAAVGRAPPREGGRCRLSVAFSPDGKTIAAGYRGLTHVGVILLDVTSRQLIADSPFAVNQKYVHHVAFLADGQMIAAGYSGSGVDRGGVVLWDFASRKRLAEYPLTARRSSEAWHSAPTRRRSLRDSMAPTAGSFCSTLTLIWQCQAGRIANCNFMPTTGGDISPIGRTVARSATCLSLRQYRKRNRSRRSGGNRSTR